VLEVCCFVLALGPCFFALWASATDAIDKQTMDATVN
jgi:hypothetical protein